MNGKIPDSDRQNVAVANAAPASASQNGRRSSRRQPERHSSQTLKPSSPANAGNEKGRHRPPLRRWREPLFREAQVKWLVMDGVPDLGVVERREAEAVRRVQVAELHVELAAGD